MKTTLKIFLFLSAFLFLFASSPHAASRQKEALQDLERAVYQNLSSYLGVKPVEPIQIPGPLSINKTVQTAEPVAEGSLELKPYVDIPPLQMEVEDHPLFIEQEKQDEEKVLLNQDIRTAPEQKTVVEKTKVPPPDVSSLSLDSLPPETHQKKEEEKEEDESMDLSPRITPKPTKTLPPLPASKPISEKALPPLPAQNPFLFQR